MSWEEMQRLQKDELVFFEKTIIKRRVHAFKNGELFKTYESIADTTQDGFSSSAVGAVIRGERKHHKGFTFTGEEPRKVQKIIIKDYDSRY